MRARGPAYTAPTYSVGLRDRNLHRLSGLALSSRHGRSFRLGVEIRTQGSGARGGATRPTRPSAPAPRRRSPRASRRSSRRCRRIGVAAYVAMRSEVDPRADLEALHRRGAEIGLPVIVPGADARLPPLRAGPCAHPRRLRDDGAGRSRRRWSIPTSSSCRSSASTGAARASATARATTTAPSPRCTPRGLHPPLVGIAFAAAGGRHHPA